MRRATHGKEAAMPGEEYSPQAIRSYRVLSCACLIAGFCGAAPAQTPAEPADQPAQRLEEVVVHARRRDETLADVPLAVSVRSGEQLREDNAVLLQDVARDVPNVRMVSSPQSVSALDVTMRG